MGRVIYLLLLLPLLASLSHAALPRELVILSRGLVYPKPQFERVEMLRDICEEKRDAFFEPFRGNLSKREIKQELAAWANEREGDGHNGTEASVQVLILHWEKWREEAEEKVYAMLNEAKFIYNEIISNSSHCARNLSLCQDRFDELPDDLQEVFSFLTTGGQQLARLTRPSDSFNLTLPTLPLLLFPPGMEPGGDLHEGRAEPVSPPPPPAPSPSSPPGPPVQPSPPTIAPPLPPGIPTEMATTQEAPGGGFSFGNLATYEEWFTYWITATFKPENWNKTKDAIEAWKGGNSSALPRFPTGIMASIVLPNERNWTLSVEEALTQGIEAAARVGLDVNAGLLVQKAVVSLSQLFTSVTEKFNGNVVEGYKMPIGEAPLSRARRAVEEASGSRVNLIFANQLASQMPTMIVTPSPSTMDFLTNANSYIGQKMAELEQFGNGIFAQIAEFLNGATSGTNTSTTIGKEEALLNSTMNGNLSTAINDLRDSLSNLTALIDNSTVVGPSTSPFDLFDFSSVLSNLFPGVGGSSGNGAASSLSPLLSTPSPITLNPQVILNETKSLTDILGNIFGGVDKGTPHHIDSDYGSSESEEKGPAASSPSSVRVSPPVALPLSSTSQVPVMHNEPSPSPSASLLSTQSTLHNDTIHPMGSVPSSSPLSAAASSSPPPSSPLLSQPPLLSTLPSMTLHPEVIINETKSLTDILGTIFGGIDKATPPPMIDETTFDDYGSSESEEEEEESASHNNSTQPPPIGTLPMATHPASASPLPPVVSSSPPLLPSSPPSMQPSTLPSMSPTASYLPSSPSSSSSSLPSPSSTLPPMLIPSSSTTFSSSNATLPSGIPSGDLKDVLIGAGFNVPDIKNLTKVVDAIDRLNELLSKQTLTMIDQLTHVIQEAFKMGESRESIVKTLNDTIDNAKETVNNLTNSIISMPGASLSWNEIKSQLMHAPNVSRDDYSEYEEYEYEEMEEVATTRRMMGMNWTGAEMNATRPEGGSMNGTMGGGEGMGGGWTRGPMGGGGGAPNGTGGPMLPPYNGTHGGHGWDSDEDDDDWSMGGGGGGGNGTIVPPPSNVTTIKEDSAHLINSTLRFYNKMNQTLTMIFAIIGDEDLSIPETKNALNCVYRNTTLIEKQMISYLIRRARIPSVDVEDGVRLRGPCSSNLTFLSHSIPSSRVHPQDETERLLLS